MKKIRVLFLAILLSCFVNSIYSQVKWMSVEEAYEKSKINKKKFFIDVYTDWCGWCKVMDKKTFSNEIISEVINKNFYPIKFNAESKEDVSFFEKIYKNNHRTHDFAIFLTNGQLSYPTTVYLNEAGELLTPVSGFLTASKLDPILHYFALEIYKEGINFDSFQKNYKPKVKE